MRRILADPTDTLLQLVFADWLDETGTSSNVAWARYLRLAVECTKMPGGDPLRPRLLEERERVGGLIRARLNYRAEVFIAYPDDLLRILPTRNMVLCLDQVTIAKPVFGLVTASWAYESLILPLVAWNGTVAVATGGLAPDAFFRSMGAWIDRQILPIPAPPQDVQKALDRHYAIHDALETRCVASAATLAHAGRTSLAFRMLDEEARIGQVLSLLIANAILDRADTLELEPRSDQVRVWHERGGGRRSQGTIAIEFRDAIVAQLRRQAKIIATGEPIEMGEIHHLHLGQLYRLATSLEATANGRLVRIAIPPGPGDRPALVNPAA